MGNQIINIELCSGEYFDKDFDVAKQKPFEEVKKVDIHRSGFDHLKIKLIMKTKYLQMKTKNSILLLLLLLPSLLFAQKVIVTPSGRPAFCGQKV